MNISLVHESIEILYIYKTNRPIDNVLSHYPPVTKIVSTEKAANRCPLLRINLRFGRIPGEITTGEIMISLNRLTTFLTNQPGMWDGMTRRRCWPPNTSGGDANPGACAWRGTFFHSLVCLARWKPSLVWKEYLALVYLPHLSTLYSSQVFTRRRTT